MSDVVFYSAMAKKNHDENLKRSFSMMADIFERYPARQVLPEHLLLAILEQGVPMIAQLFKHLSVNSSVIESGLRVRLQEVSHEISSPPGELDFHSSTLAIFDDAEEMREQIGHDQVGVDHVLLACLRQTGTFVFDLLSEHGLTANNVGNTMLWLRSSTTKSGLQEALSGAIANPQKARDIAEPADSSALGGLGLDMTVMARSGSLDPVIGRDGELKRVINILCRRTKNNPVLVGDAGVGKTAVAEGLAMRITDDQVPVSLQGKRVISLDVSSLVSGTSMRGQFEERLSGIIDEVVGSGGQVILFIDEIHQLVGAGATSNSSMDAGNILKPYLARGQIRCIGATTFDEYSKHIEKDPALSRRFQKVTVSEPTVEESLSILRGLRDKYEAFHRVSILDDSLKDAVKLSHRYITDRKLPDKAIDLIDEAASRKRIEIDSPPAKLDMIREKIRHLELERASLKKDTKARKNSTEGKATSALSKRLKRIEQEIIKQNIEADNVRESWSKSVEELSSIASLKARIEAVKLDIKQATKAVDLRKAAELEEFDLRPLESLLNESLGRSDSTEKKNIDGAVTAEDIASVVAEWTGIPSSQLREEESQRLLAMEAELSKSVVGQENAKAAITRCIKIARSGLGNASRPLGSFLFLGPTGVGKTELAKALSKFLFNDRTSLTRLDMSEYYDRYTVSRLIGAAPGYVGHDDGGQLTEAVRRKPYSCILFDELEKAHNDIYNVLLQILDEGRLTDSRGRLVDLTNTVIIMTSNIGAELVLEEHSSKKELVARSNIDDTVGGIDALSTGLKTALLNRFKPEFLNRIDDIVVFQPLTVKQVQEIVARQVNDLSKQLMELEGIEIAISPKVTGWLAEKAFDPMYGARPIKRAIYAYLEAPLAERILDRKSGSDSQQGLDAKPIAVDIVRKKLILK